MKMLTIFTDITGKIPRLCFEIEEFGEWVNIIGPILLLPTEWYFMTVIKVWLRQLTQLLQSTHLSNKDKFNQTNMTQLSTLQLLVNILLSTYCTK